MRTSSTTPCWSTAAPGGQPVARGPRRDPRGSHRLLPRRSVAPHPRGRSRAGGARRARRMLAGVLVRSRTVPRPCARPRSRLGLRATGGADRWLTRHRASPRPPCQAEPPMRSVQVERYSPPDVIVHCAMCALCDNRLRRSSAPLRRGEVPLGAATGRPWLRPKFRQGSFLARLH